MIFYKKIENFSGIRGPRPPPPEPRQIHAYKIFPKFSQKIGNFLKMKKSQNFHWPRQACALVQKKFPRPPELINVWFRHPPCQRKNVLEKFFLAYLGENYKSDLNLKCSKTLYNNFFIMVRFSLEYSNTDKRRIGMGRCQKSIKRAIIIR